jgi:hypothetical protein
MRVGDLVKAVLADGSVLNGGIIVETDSPQKHQKTKRITVLLDNGRLLSTRASYNLWEVVNDNR